MASCPDRRDLLQALQTDWIVTKGGKMPRLLNPDVARGAANVAAARRLRNMVHGAVAMDPGSPGSSQRGADEHRQEYRKRHMAQGQRGQETLGYRCASALLLLVVSSFGCVSIEIHCLLLRVSIPAHSDRN